MDTNQVVIFDDKWARAIFPPERTDAFFEALFGEAEEGAYDISLRFVKVEGATYEFAFDLAQRPGKCLACNLTYGLPQVLMRHPVLDLKGVVHAIAKAAGGGPASAQWKVGATRELSPSLHSIPLLVTVLEKTSQDT